ncbi:hypothetical protein [Pseudomonas sp. IT-P253]|uniref:hypothetical protein n=1 Tax=Pseudomonas sp. IT-P253 TaxID=3026455 RepID=UPI0039E18EAF
MFVQVVPKLGLGVFELARCCRGTKHFNLSTSPRHYLTVSKLPLSVVQEKSNGAVFEAFICGNKDFQATLQMLIGDFEPLCTPLISDKGNLGSTFSLAFLISSALMAFHISKLLFRKAAVRRLTGQRLQTEIEKHNLSKLTVPTEGGERWDTHHQQH